MERGVEGYRPNQLHASDFEFSASSLSAADLLTKDVFDGPTYDHSAVADALSSGSSFGSHASSFSHGAFGGDSFDHGVAALAMQAHI